MRASAGGAPAPRRPAAAHGDPRLRGLPCQFAAATLPGM